MSTTQASGMALVALATFARRGPTSRSAHRAAPRSASVLTRRRSRWYGDDVNSVWASSTTSAIGRRFEGKVAFVTGGASGLGRAAAERFAREGARVIVAHLDRIGAEAVAASLPDALALQVDTADGAAVDRSFEVAL